MVSYDMIWQSNQFGVENRFALDGTMAEEIEYATKQAVKYRSPWFKINNNYYLCKDVKGNNTEWHKAINESEKKWIKNYSKKHGFDLEWFSMKNKPRGSKKYLAYYEYHADGLGYTKREFDYAPATNSFKEVKNLAAFFSSKWIIFNGKYYVWKRSEWILATNQEIAKIRKYMLDCNAKYNRKFLPHWNEWTGKP